MQPDLAAAVLSGDRRALARAISTLEDRRAGAADLAAALSSARRGVPVVGITGPPGAGKSTLTTALVRELRDRALTVAVVAVDPSSPVSGGAVLGDRVRMLEHADDPGVFVRSLSARGRVGGLSWTIVPVLDVLDAGGFDVILLETVGAGQSDVDVAGLADRTVVVVAPGAGDDVQAMKAGILEIGDVLVVNKGDLPGADTTRRDLVAALALAGGEHAPVVTTVATTGSGVSELVGLLPTEPTGHEGLRRRAQSAIRLAAEARVRASMADTSSLASLAAEVVAGTMDPEAAADRWLSGQGSVDG